MMFKGFFLTVFVFVSLMLVELQAARKCNILFDLARFAHLNNHPDIELCKSESGFQMIPLRYPNAQELAKICVSHACNRMTARIGDVQGGTPDCEYEGVNIRTAYNQVSEGCRVTI